MIPSFVYGVSFSVLQPVQDLVCGRGSEVAALLTGFVAVPFDLLEQDPRVRGPALRQLREVAGELFNSLASDLWHGFPPPIPPP
jgi:hypothetical protein